MGFTTVADGYLPVAKALPRPLICMGMISLMKTQEIGPKDREKMTETRKRKKTPALETPSRVPPGFCWLMTASQMREMVIPAAPKSKGFLRPTRSRMKKMKIRLAMGPTTL